MRRIVVIALGAALSLTAGTAAACPYPHHPHHQGHGAYEDGGRSWRHEDERYEAHGYEERRYRDDYAASPPPLIGASAWYMDGRHPAPPCDCEPVGGAVQLSDTFFYDAGGVGPIPDGDWYGGGYYMAGGGHGYGFSHASARSFAGASASVQIRGGRHFGGGGHHKGGHKGYAKGGKKGGKG